jgi:hypothetical protein
MAIAVAIAETDDAERWVLVVRAVDRDEDIAVRRYRHVTCLCRLAVFHQVGDDERAESSRKRETGVVGVAARGSSAVLVVIVSVVAIGADRRARARCGSGGPFRAAGDEYRERDAAVNQMPGQTYVHIDLHIMAMSRGR